MSLCVAVLVAREDGGLGSVGVVSVGGARSRVALDLVPQARPGDALLVHAGVALGRVEEEKKEEEPPCA
jgi:hydrogenase maturation factor